MMAIPDSVGIGPLFKRKYSQTNPQRLTGIIRTDEHGTKYTVAYVRNRWIRIDLLERAV